MVCARFAQGLCVQGTQEQCVVLDVRETWVKCMWVKCMSMPDFQSTGMVKRGAPGVHTREETCASACFVQVGHRSDGCSAHASERHGSARHDRNMRAGYATVHKAHGLCTVCLCKDACRAR